MAPRSRHWIWFPTRQDWIAGTPLGARDRFIIWGQDVVWARSKPRRPGMGWAETDPTIRGHAWDAFALRVAANAASRHHVMDR